MRVREGDCGCIILMTGARRAMLESSEFHFFVSRPSELLPTIHDLPNSASMIKGVLDQKHL